MARLVIGTVLAAWGLAAPAAAQWTNTTERDEITGDVSWYAISPQVSASPCSGSHSAERIPDEIEAWEATLRTTVTEPVEYTDGGVQCLLTRTTCVVEECTYARSQDPRFEPGQGWALIVDGELVTIGPGDDTAEAALAACRSYYGR